ncbi:unnamed protein product [Mytilus coruscus]|uniref:Uncharacterized protein n=1 Tax=Mytilus coruscus TaxID=42192 RepID=A0A6J8B4Q9_MYTCO|nr:unnamed protein product [Mytilus coruscus]
MKTSIAIQANVIPLSRSAIKHIDIPPVPPKVLTKSDIATINIQPSEVHFISSAFSSPDHSSTSSPDHFHLPNRWITLQLLLYQITCHLPSSQITLQLLLHLPNCWITLQLLFHQANLQSTNNIIREPFKSHISRAGQYSIISITLNTTDQGIPDNIIQKSKLKAGSDRRKFGVDLFREICSLQDVYQRNVRGKASNKSLVKEQINPEKILAIKTTCMNYFPATLSDKAGSWNDVT